MKPNFALNLSHDGISLLHRAKAGWLRVGGVALDDPDLGQHLKLLRRTAADLESGGLTSKLVIPNSQVLYTEIEVPGPDRNARLSQIRDGLVGLTPYDVDDLVFDWRLAGTRAQVAVVARETLSEAEAFAAEFRFNPICFVAIPVDDVFDGEPFFGHCKHADALLVDGETIEPDTEKMVVLGDKTPRARPAGEDKVLLLSQQADGDEPADPAGQADAAGEKPRARSKANSKANSKAGAKAGSKAKSKPKPETKSEAPEPETETGTVAITFTSRRATAKPIEPLPPPAPRITPRARAADTALDIDDIPDMPAWRSTNGHAPAPMPVTAAHAADLDEPVDRKRVARDKALAAGTAIAGTLGKLGKGAANGMQASRNRQAAIAASATEADAMTVFGARGGTVTRGKPRYLGLMLTVLLLLALAVLALWSTYFLGDRQIALPGPDPAAPQIAAVDPVQTIVDAPLAETELEPEPEPAAVDTIQTPEPVNPDPITAAVEEALSDPALPLEDPAGAIADAPEMSGAATETETGPDATALAMPEPDPEEAADAGLETAMLQPAGETPAMQPAPDQVTQPPPTRAEAETSYAATGIWQLDPEPLPGLAGGDRLEDIYVASIDPVVTSQDAVALPDAGSLTNDLRPDALRPPAALGITFDLDARGLVRASPDGTLSPDGVLVYSGVPAVVPGIRPGAAGSEQAATPGGENLDPETERLRQIRPKIRPDTLQETNERSRLGGFSITELAGIRPAIRPRSIQEAAEADLQEEVAQAEEPEPESDAESATDLAVVASLSPKLRPSDFSATVEKALQEAAQSPSKPDPAPDQAIAAARVPSIPSTASVAKQATERNAINLSKVNLIGVYGSPSDRRALVRLKSGRYIKVEVGDRVDGGRVAAIGDDELRYVKGGRNITLKMPKG
ncbi:MAG: hypothetical protein LJE68_10020 [Rhodobacter sp.]|nr:hypothetical protein [Rhodobacter sp.]